MSGIKPEEFLKEEYLCQFLKKSPSVKSTCRELDNTSPCFVGKENIGDFCVGVVSRDRDNGRGIGNKVDNSRDMDNSVNNCK